MKRVVYIIISSLLFVWPFLGKVDHHDFVSSVLMPEPLFLCNRSFHVAKGEFILRGSGCFPLIQSPGEGPPAEGSLLWSSQQPPLHCFPLVLCKHQRKHLLHRDTRSEVCCSWSVLYGQVPLGKGIASLLFDDAGGWSNIEWIYSLPPSPVVQEYRVNKGHFTSY